MLGLACLVLPGPSSRWLLQDAAATGAGAQVDASLERTQDTFLSLSAARAGLAVIEGSSVGVGFDLQVGDVVQPVYDLLHFFWRLFLFAFLILAGYKLLLETGVLALGVGLLGLGGVLGAAGFLVADAGPRLQQALPDARQRLHALARGAVLAGLVVGYLLPLSLLLTEWLAVRYTRPLEDRYRQEIARFVSELDAARSDLGDADAKPPPWYRPDQQVDELSERLAAAAARVAAAFDAALPSLGFYAVLSLLDHLILPFVSALVLFRLARVGLARLAPSIRP